MKNIIQGTLTLIGLIAFGGVTLFGAFLALATPGIGPDALYQNPTFWSRLAGCVFVLIGFFGQGWITYEDKVRHGEQVDC